MQTQTTSPPSAEAVVRWRRTQLTRAGFPRSLAVDVSSDPRYDLHALIELTERGCPAALAVRILAPLDEERVS